jgi:hypothetical protein
MTLTYTRADKTTGSVRVKFDPPLIAYDEVGSLLDSCELGLRGAIAQVRPRLTQMKYEAEEGLDMVRVVSINTV